MYDPTKPYKSEIFKLISSTWKSPFLKVKPGVYTIFQKKHTFFEVDHTDGIGTKAESHWKFGSFSWAVQDVLAMNLNDLAMERAFAYKLQNHITLPKDDHEAILKIVRSLVRQCKKRNIVITGGETSIHSSQNVFDISMCVSGLVEKVRKNKLRAGDVLVGLRSSGVHSNGFTLLRKVLGKSILKNDLRPTKIYSDEIYKLNKIVDIHGMMHITGGAYTKLKDISDSVDIHISNRHRLKPQKIFKHVHKKGVVDKEMYRTFNCGVGFVLSVAKKDVDEVLLSLDGSDVIGEVVKGSGKIKIESAFSRKTIEY